MPWGKVTITSNTTTTQKLKKKQEMKNDGSFQKEQRLTEANCIQL